MKRLQAPSYDELTQEFLHEVLELRDGKFYWKQSPYKHYGTPVGGRADHVMLEATGHMAVDIWPHSFSSARLAILYETGQKTYKVPKHKNGNNADNRIENLVWPGSAEKAKAQEKAGKFHKFITPAGYTIVVRDGDMEYLRDTLADWIKEHGEWDGSKWSK